MTEYIEMWSFLNSHDRNKRNKLGLDWSSFRGFGRIWEERGTSWISLSRDCFIHNPPLIWMSITYVLARVIWEPSPSIACLGRGDTFDFSYLSWTGLYPGNLLIQWVWEGQASIEGSWCSCLGSIGGLVCQAELPEFCSTSYSVQYSM